MPSPAKLACLVLFAAAIQATAAEPAKKPSPVSFHRQIRPILQQKCQGCHQPAKLKGDLLLTSYEGFAKGGAHGNQWVVGKPDESLVMKHLLGAPEHALMPEGEAKLPDNQLKLFADWIRQGAKDDTPEQFKRTLVSREPPVYTKPVCITAMAYSPDGSSLAVAGYREVLLHKPDGSGLEARLVGLSQRIESIVFSPDGDTLLVAGGSAGRFGELQFWNWKKRKLTFSLMPSFDTVYGACFSTDGKKVSFGCADNSVRIIDAEEGKPLLRLDHHQDWVFGTALSLDGKYIVSAGRDRAVKLCEVANGSFIDNITTITPGMLGGGLRCLVRRPGKDEYLTAGEDGIPKLYRMLRTQNRFIGDDANLIRNYEKLAGRVETLAFSKDGKLLAAGGTGGTARVYQTDDAKVIARIAVPTSVFAVSFHPDGKQIALAGLDGKVRIHSLPDGKLVKEFVPVPMGKSQKSTTP